MKDVIFNRRSSWSNPTIYADYVAVLGSTYACRTWCDPYDVQNGNKACDLAFNSMQTGMYVGHFFIDNWKFGKCIEINGGGEVPGLWPDSNNGMRPILTGVYIHHGYSMTWAGSAGCLTIRPDDVDAFFGLFAPDELVNIWLQCEAQPIYKAAA